MEEGLEGLQMQRTAAMVRAVVFVVTKPKNCNIKSLPVQCGSVAHEFKG